MKITSPPITEGPWAWQKFGTDYMLIAQEGMRNIILNAIRDESMIPQLAVRIEGIMRPIYPSHPDAKIIEQSKATAEALKKTLLTLVAAKKSIRTWHGMGMNEVMEIRAWAIYEMQAPEMKIINAQIENAKATLIAAGYTIEE